MTREEFTKFCYEEYKRSVDGAEVMYRRYPFVLTTIALLCAGLYAVVRDGLWVHFFVRVDVTVFYLSAIAASFALALATAALTASIWPKAYSGIGSVESFAAWVAQYRRELEQAGRTSAEIEPAASQNLNSAVQDRLAEAVSMNLKAGRLRQQFFNWCINFLTASLIAFALTGVSAWMLKLRGI